MSLGYLHTDVLWLFAHRCPLAICTSMPLGFLRTDIPGLFSHRCPLAICTPMSLGYVHINAPRLFAHRSPWAICAPMSFGYLHTDVPLAVCTSMSLGYILPSFLPPTIQNSTIILIIAIQSTPFLGGQSEIDYFKQALVFTCLQYKSFQKHCRKR